MRAPRLPRESEASAGKKAADQSSPAKKQTIGANEMCQLLVSLRHG